MRNSTGSADLMGDEELAGFLDGIRANVRRTASQLPQHEVYVKQYCGTKP